MFSQDTLLRDMVKSWYQRESLRIIMQAGLDAPSGCNKQTTSLIGVDDPEVLKKLKAVIQPPVAETVPAHDLCAHTENQCLSGSVLCGAGLFGCYREYNSGFRPAWVETEAVKESTLRKAIAYGKLINGMDVCKFGKQWVISKAAMEREYGLPKERA